MKYRLTKREKVLLYVLTCLIILVGGWFFVVQPTLEEMDQANQNYQNKKMELIATKSQYISVDEINKETIKAKDEIESISNKYKGVMVYEDVDKFLTSLLFKHNLKPVSLEMGMIEEKDLVSYQESKKENTDKKGIKIKGVETKASISGNLVDIFNLVQEVSTMPSVQVTSIDYSTINGETPTFSMGVIIYMIEK